MTVSVRLDPVLEAKLTQQASLPGITKSAFIKDALERVPGMKNPASLLRELRSGGKSDRRDASANVSRQMKAKLRVRNVLIDAGPLIALFATDDYYHDHCDTLVTELAGDGCGWSPPSWRAPSGSSRTPIGV